VEGSEHDLQVHLLDIGQADCILIQTLLGTNASMMRPTEELLC